MVFKQKDRIRLYYRQKFFDSLKKRALFFIPFFVFLTYFINNFIIFYIIIEDDSMSPNIEQGERVGFDRFNLPIRWPFTRNHATEISFIALERGDIIAFENPHNAPVGAFLQFLDIPLSMLSLGLIDLAPRQIALKRIIGLPGDSLKIVDKQIYLNQKRFDSGNKWIIHYQDNRIFASLVSSRDNVDDVFIPNGYVYVLSDNWDYFNDSRIYGLVPFYKIEGIARDDY